MAGCRGMAWSLLLLLWTRLDVSRNALRDSATVLEALSGVDPRDSTSVPQPVPHYARGLTTDIKGLRLGLAKEYMVGGLDPEVRQAIDAAVKQFEKLGAEIRRNLACRTPTMRLRPTISSPQPRPAPIWRVSTGSATAPGLRAPTHLDLYSQNARGGFWRGSQTPHSARHLCLEQRLLRRILPPSTKGPHARFGHDFLQAFEKVDAIITPTSPSPAFKIGEKADDPLQMYLMDIYTISANLAGICGISVPCGFTTLTQTPDRSSAARQALR